MDILNNKKNILTSNNKIIDVYDNLFGFRKREIFLDYMSNSVFRTKGGDGLISKDYNQLFSNYNKQDLDNIEFYNTEGYKFLDDKYKLYNRKLLQCRVNVCSSFDHTEAHCDTNGISLLLYVNLSWDIFWGGHTIFYNEDLSEIEYTCIFKPGRITVFDGSIPHSISPISNACRELRYTFVIQYSNG